MNPYDTKAWREINERRARVESRKARNVVPQRVRERGRGVADRGRDVFNDLPGSEQVQQALSEALRGLTQAVGTTATASISRRAVVARYRRRGYQVTRVEDIRSLTLEASDAAFPRRKRLVYISASALQGGVAGAATTVSEAGSVLGGVASGGAGAVPGALAVVGVLAADAAATLTTATRIAAETGALYGYDPVDPGEELFMAAVLGVAMASSQAAKVAAYRELHMLAYRLARRATWETLNKSYITKIVRQVWERLGERLTQQQLGKTTPALGIAIGAGVNAHLMHRVADEAYFAYRERRLSERYGGDPGAPSYVPNTPDGGRDGNQEGTLVLDLLDQPTDE